jgi:hypothetical protein
VFMVNLHEVTATADGIEIFWDALANRAHATTGLHLTFLRGLEATISTASQQFSVKKPITSFRSLVRTGSRPLKRVDLHPLLFFLLPARRESALRSQ